MNHREWDWKRHYCSCLVRGEKPQQIAYTSEFHFNYGRVTIYKNVTSKLNNRQPPSKYCLRKKSLHEILSFITALHGMQTRSYDEISVRPSVCLSICQTRALWQNGRKICLDFYIIRKNIYPSFLRRRRMVGGGRPLLPEILGQPARVGAKSPILNR